MSSEKSNQVQPSKVHTLTPEEDAAIRAHPLSDQGYLRMRMEQGVTYEQALKELSEWHIVM